MTTTMITPGRDVARRISADRRRTPEGVIASYIHHNGRLGVIVEVNCESVEGAREPALAALARDLAEHIAGAAPLTVRREELSPALVAQRRRAFEDEVRSHGKPESLVAEAVDAKMDVYLSAVVLVDQRSLREPSITIGELIEQVAATIGERVQVRRFSRFHMGLA